MNRKIIISILIVIISYAVVLIIKKVNWHSKLEVGEVVDAFNEVNVYYNGGVSNSEGRNLSVDGYNIGMKYQCVEFIKRYYYEHLNHKMPDTYGNAVDFYDKSLKDGNVNLKRGLVQFSNPSSMKPKEDDILIFDKTFFNRYGHVVIVCKVQDSLIEIIQQNPGPFGSSREIIKIRKQNNLWLIDNKRILGRLSK
ncbi:CHAP domain-containing protein [Flavobacterium sp.]|uniref:CHAP domain-containing protein n=1 Tax=Flavobacterium sp. TaxID=239 RepID=UPI003C47E727